MVAVKLLLLLLILLFNFSFQIPHLHCCVFSPLLQALPGPAWDIPVGEAFWESLRGMGAGVRADTSQGAAVPLSQPGRSIPSTGAVGQPLVSGSWGCSQRRIPKPRPCPAASGVPGSSLGIPDSKMGKPRESPLQVFPGDPTALEQWPGAEGQLAPGSPAPFPPKSPIQGCSHSPRARPGMFHFPKNSQTFPLWLWGLGSSRPREASRTLHS